MTDYYEIGKMINKLLNKASEEDLTIWLVEEETGESLKLYDYLNSEKHHEDAVFKKVE
jgi:hypothetical protein